MQQQNTMTNVLANSEKNDNVINVNNNQVKDLSKRKYIIKEIDHTDQYYCASQISKNEKYLAYGGHDLLLKIYDLEFDKLIKEIKQKYAFTVCQFTSDSSLLYVGSYQFVIEYNVLKDFKLNKKFYLHKYNVLNMITIENQFLLTSSYDRKIIKTDTKNQKQLFKLKGQTNYINTLDYNEIDDIIISGSYDNFIKLWSGKNRGILISKYHAYGILQIQLINKRQNLLSLDHNKKIQEWEIDLIHRDLVLIKQYNDLGVVYHFQQVNQGCNLLLICDCCIKILNNQGQTIKLIENQAEASTYLDFNQLDSVNFIKIRQKNKIQLAIAQD